MSYSQSLSRFVKAALQVLLLTLVMFVLMSAIYSIVGVGQESSAVARPIEQGLETAPGAPASLPADQGSLLLILLGVCLLQTMVLSMAVLRSRWSGWRLVVAIFSVMFVTATVLPQIDAAYFLAMCL